MLTPESGVISSRLLLRLPLPRQSLRFGYLGGGHFTGRQFLKLDGLLVFQRKIHADGLHTAAQRGVLKIETFFVAHRITFKSSPQDKAPEERRISA